MNEPENLVFDYSTVDADTKRFLLECEVEISFILQRSGYQIGQILISAKERLPHGEFGKWFKAKWGWSDRTAQNMMNIARNFKSAGNADSFPREAQNLLAAPSTPESARTEAIEKAESGETLTIKQTKELDLTMEQIPTIDTRAQIADLETLLEAAINKPTIVETVTVEKIPDDCPALISERDVLVDKKTG